MKLSLLGFYLGIAAVSLQAIRARSGRMRLPLLGLGVTLAVLAASDSALARALRFRPVQMAAADARMVPVYAQLAQRAKDLSAGAGRPLWIGIAGFPGSGKTSMARAVQDLLIADGVPTVTLPMDGFHFYRRELDAFADPAEAHARRGAPFTFDVGRFVDKLEEVRGAGVGTWPSFDHAEGDPIEDAIRVEAGTRVVILEGIYLLLREPSPWAAVRTFLDESWFVDVHMDVAVERLAQRHMRAWGWDYERARERAELNDRRNMETIRAHGRDSADRFIPSL